MVLVKLRVRTPRVLLRAQARQQAWQQARQRTRVRARARQRQRRWVRRQVRLPSHMRRVKLVQRRKRAGASSKCRFHCVSVEIMPRALTPHATRPYYPLKLTSNSTPSPNLFIELGSSAATTAATTDDSAELVWEAHVDATTGQTYYYCASTGVTSWGETDLTTWDQHEHDGQPYWYNRVTKRTTWSNPA